MANLIRLGLFIVSWLSVIFLPKKSFLRYLPVANFAATLILITSKLAVPLKLWTVEGDKPNEKIYNDLSFIFGPFFIGTLWIFHLTFGKFRLYFILNLILDFFLAFPMCYVFQKLKVFKLVNFKPIYIFVTHTLFAFFLYGYQLVINKARR